MMNAPSLKYETENNTDFADTLLKDTQNLTEPVCYDNFFNNEFLNEEDVKIAINKALDKKAKERFRIWIDKNQRNDLFSKMIIESIHDNDSLEQWSEKIFGKEKFCIFFNNAEQFNDQLATKIAKSLLPIFQKKGITLGGISMVLLIGNYGFTPSGLHQDPDENCVFHFHLGPGTKNLYTLSPDKFKNVTCSDKTCFELEKILEHARCFELKRNSFFSLPPLHYHIGRTEQFSIGIAIVISDLTNVQLAQEIFKNFGLDGSNRSKNVYKLKNYEFGTAPEMMVSEATSHICISEKHKKKTFEEIINLRIKDYYLKMLSNLGWSSPPLFIQGQEKDLKQRKIKLIEPYKIYYNINDLDTISIFMRGRELVAKYKNNLPSLIEVINSGQILDVSTLISKYVIADDPKDLTLTFISQAIEHSAIEFVD